MDSRKECFRFEGESKHSLRITKITERSGAPALPRSLALSHPRWKIVRRSSRNTTGPRRACTASVGMAASGTRRHASRCALPAARGQKTTAPHTRPTSLTSVSEVARTAHHIQRCQTRARRHGWWGTRVGGGVGGVWGAGVLVNWNDLIHIHHTELKNTVYIYKLYNTAHATGLIKCYRRTTSELRGCMGRRARRSSSWQIWSAPASKAPRYRLV